MRNISRRHAGQVTCAAAGALWLSLSGSALAQVQPSSEVTDLRAEVAALKDQVKSYAQQVEQLHTQRGENWLTEQRAAEIKGLVQDVLADADTRASLLQSGAVSGWDNGFFIASADGNFRLRLSAEMEFTFFYNHQSNSLVDDNRWGFENSRTALIFTGNVVNPDWLYTIVANFNGNGGGFGLEDAVIGRVLGNGWTLHAGQFKLPILREELVSNPFLLAVERSLVNSEFTAGRSQGVALDYRGDMLHAVASFNDGLQSTGGFNSPALTLDTEYSLSGRVEALMAGTWGQFNDFTSFRGEAPAFMLGTAFHFQNGEFGTPADEIEILQWTVDASTEFGGANLFASIVGRHLDSATLSADQFGAVVQGGYFLTERWELFIRYEWGDDDIADENLSVITVGTNHYFSRHMVKWSTDIGVGLNEVTATWGDGLFGGGGGGAGWRTDSPGEDGQVVIRSQLQLLF